MFGDEGIVIEVLRQRHRRDHYLVDFGPVFGESEVSETDLEPIAHLSPRRPVAKENPELRARALQAYLRDQQEEEEEND